MTTDSLMEVKSIAELALGAFYNTFYIYFMITELDNQFLIFLRMAILHRFYCIVLTVIVVPPIMLKYK